MVTYPTEEPIGEEMWDCASFRSLFSIIRSCKEYKCEAKQWPQCPRAWEKLCPIENESNGNDSKEP